MAFNAVLTERSAADYQRIRDAAAADKSTSKARGLFKQVHGCIAKLLSNPRHPGLHTHKFQSLEHPYKKGQPVFEAYVQNQTPGAYRLFWCYGPGPNDVTIIAITPHP